MRRRVWLLTCIVVFLSTSAFAQVFDREKERKETLELINNPPIQTLQVTGMETATAEEAELVQFYREAIFPRVSQMKLLSFRANMYQTALDRALYNPGPDGADAPEMLEWQSEQQSAEKGYNKISTSKDWLENAKRFGEIAKRNNLTGSLADYARRLATEIELGNFTEAELPMLDRLSEIQIAISKIANTSPYVEKLAASEQAVNAAIDSYFAGTLSFEQAWKAIEAQQSQGRTAHGQDIASKGRDLFNEAAVIRTRLAHAKGFATWADYAVAQEARQNAAQFKTVDGRIKFLTDLLAATEAPFLAFRGKRMMEVPEVDPADIHVSQLALLELQSDSLVRPYLRKEKIEEIWRDTMLASGFDPQKLQNIHWDSFPRKGKYTHAYMNNASQHEPKVLNIQANGLLVVLPPDTPEHWFDAIIYVVGNARDHGLSTYTTNQHEGGHALNFAYERDVFANGASYGWVETHSMTMEAFMTDLKYLLSIARDEAGNPIPRELAERFVQNAVLNAYVRERRQIGNALHDLTLWNYDFEAGSEKFVDRAVRVFGEIQGTAQIAKGVVVDGVDWRMGGFSTNHFYSGNVRYFGYIVAYIAAEMTAKRLHDVLRETTGQATFLNQPSIAPLLIEAYYRNGFSKPFPNPVEHFTGEAFSAEAFACEMARAVEAYVPSCKQQLKTLGR